MKKLFIISLFILSINISYAQKEYKKLWAELEQLELEGKFKSANGVVDRILKKANDCDQIVKAFIYQSKFSLLLEEDAQKRVIANLESTIQTSAFPTNSILESIYANFLQQYLDQNRYKIRKRSTVENPIETLEFEKWDINTLVSQIARHYELSLQNSSELKKLPIKDYREILTESQSSHKFRPTLYDFLTHRAIEFYQSNKWYAKRPKEKFYINNSIVFESTKEFSQELFPTKDSLFSNRNALKLYQQLELFHEKFDSTAYVDIVLERLNFVQKKATIENKDELYVQALQKLSNRFKKHESSTLIDYTIANYYYKTSMQYNAKYDHTLKNYRIKALRICNTVLKNYPNSDGGLLCTILKNQIEHQSVSIQTENYILPDKAFLAKVNFKSIDTLYLSAYRVPIDFYNKRTAYKKDSLLLEALRKIEPTISHFYQLQSKKNYFEYSTEVDVPALPLGSYLLVSSKTKDIKSIDQIYNHAVITVSKLTMLNINQDKHMVLKLLDRESGKPRQNVKILISNSEGYNQSGITNSNGEFIIEKDKKYHHYDIVATHGTDTITNTNQYLSQYYKRKNRDKEHIAKTYLYLDRSIYRPGQTMYFKGLLTEKKNGESKVVPNTYVSIIISDVNNKEIKEFRLKTNEYGSVSGEFTLPKNTLTGEFTIEMDEDFGNEIEESDPYYDKIDDLDYTELTFSVEEYKRPKFEVLFDAAKDNYTLGDSVTATGFAKAFLGSNVTDSKVSYTISREVMANWRRNFYGGPSQIIKTGTSRTDSKGKFSIDFIAVPDSLSKKKDKPVFLYTINADITDKNGETRSSSQTIRIGYHNLKVNVIMASKLNAGSPQKIRIDTKNLNDQLIDTDVEMVITKLNGPGRVLREKPWDIVEIHSISREKFIQTFPNEVYDSTDLKQNWPKGKIVFRNKAGFKDAKEFPLSNLSKWEPGVYKLEVKAIDTCNDTVSVSKNFEVYHPRKHSLSDHQMFAYEIVNLDFKKDKFVSLKLKTACDQLNVNVEAYYKNDLVFKKLVTIDKGYTIVKIPVKEYYKNKLDFNLFFVKFNSISKNQFSANFREIENKLNIETLSFRNKLTPGQKESWSFKITNSDDKKAQAEVLASMYDSSLDQFKSHSWKTDIGFHEYSYSRAPYIQSNYFGVKHFSDFNFLRFTNTIPFLKKYHKLNWFGLYFGGTLYSNKVYLKKLSNKSRKINYIEGNINGIVTDETGMPIPGVSIMVKGTKIGAITDIDGYYSIKAPKGSVLVYSFIGMKSSEMVAAKSGTYNIALKSDMLACDEVVVTSMGIARKEFKTGSVSYVNVSDIRNDIFSQLQGAVAGVEILEECEEEDEDMCFIKIRGNSTLESPNTPLFIIDGVPVDAKIGARFSPQDVADITVLKGGSATAIYGARARNGVVIISTKKGLEELTQVETRSNLKETAFFFPHLWTNKKGEIIFNFESPEALTKWKLMLLAHNKSAESGSLEKIVVTQKNLNVIPNVPRFLREDDTITLSAKISNLTKENLTGSAALYLFDGVTGNPVDKKQIPFEPTVTFSVESKGSSMVSWSLKIPKGMAALQYKIVAKSGSHSDGEMNIIPVLSNRTLVTEARPLWVLPGTSKEVQFEKLKQVNSPSQSNHKISLEYTSNPAWLTLKSLPYLMKFPHECAEQVFSRFYSNVLAQDIINKNPKIKEVFKSWYKGDSTLSPLEKNEDLKSILISESPWIRDLQDDEENKALMASLFDNEKLKTQQLQAVSKLNELQLSSGAFPWFSGGSENTFITQHIVAGIGHLQKLNIHVDYGNNINSLLKKAIAYLDEKFIDQHHKLTALSKDTTNVSLSPRDLHYLYCRSFFNTEYPQSENLKQITKVYIEKCKTDWITKSLYNKTLTALVLHRNGEQNTAKLILEALSEQAVINEENGMYWKENRSGWLWHQSPIETQALLIETFSEVDGDMTKVNRLKQWLIKNKQTNKWSTTKATTEAIYALLMHGSNCLSISDNTTITIGEEKISSKKLESSTKEAGTGYFKLNWNKKEINSSMATVKVSNKGKITGFGGVYWQYFEDLDRIIDSEKGPLQVKKSLFIKKSTNDGETLLPISKQTKVKIGDLITVRLEIASRNDMEFVHLKDLRAAGLEPVDVLSGYNWQDGLAYYQSTKDVATHFFFDKLHKGTYVFEYDLRANNKGNFSAGNATIQSMYAPEFTSHSKGDRFLID